MTHTKEEHRLTVRLENRQHKTRSGTGSSLEHKLFFWGYRTINYFIYSADQQNI